jgi:hypothetical protein
MFLISKMRSGCNYLTSKSTSNMGFTALILKISRNDLMWSFSILYQLVYGIRLLSIRSISSVWVIFGNRFDFAAFRLPNYHRMLSHSQHFRKWFEYCDLLLDRMSAFGFNTKWDYWLLESISISLKHLNSQSAARSFTSVELLESESSLSLNIRLYLWFWLSEMMVSLSGSLYCRSIFFAETISNSLQNWLLLMIHSYACHLTWLVIKCVKLCFYGLLTIRLAF